MTAHETERPAENAEWDAIPDTHSDYLRGWNDAMAANLRRPDRPDHARRERIATALLAGVMASQWYRSEDDSILLAMRLADGLIAALDAAP